MAYADQSRRRRRRRRRSEGLRRAAGRLRLRWKLMIFSLIPLLLLLGLGELAARSLWSPPEPPKDLPTGTQMKAHPTRMWALKPGALTQFGVETEVGADGLRVAPTVGAERRILILGDSSFFGHGLADPDTLHVQLREQLAARGVSADVLCGAVPGYSTEQTLLLLDEVGWALEPDLLIVGNLWSDNNFDRFVDREWLAVLHSPSARINRALSASRLWLALQFTLNRPEAPWDHEGFTPVTWVRTPYETGHRRVPLAAYGENLDRLMLESAEHDAGVVLFQPVNRERLKGAQSETSWDVYFDVQRAVGARRGALLFDGLPPLRERGVGHLEAFLDELHPTGATNAIFAEALAGALVEAGWPEAALIPDPGPAPWSGAPSDPWAGEVPWRGVTPMGSDATP